MRCKSINFKMCAGTKIRDSVTNRISRQKYQQCDWLFQFIAARITRHKLAWMLLRGVRSRKRETRRLS